MSADVSATETDEFDELGKRDVPGDSTTSAADSPAGENNGQDEEEEDEEEDEEPKLKYAKLTANVANIYRSGDSTSAFTVVGDKMLVGTHVGSIHVLAVPTMQSLRTYRAHTASVTSLSISPVPPAPALVRNETGSASLISPPASTKNPATSASKPNRTSSQRSHRSTAVAVPNTPNNQVYIATSSVDGHVCISSLINPEDVQLRNFARPVNAVTLSPEYKSDRTYLSGGLAGNLVLTVGGRAGVSTDANTNRAAAAASGWLGSLGLSSNTGKDRILHSGEGAIGCIKWSLSSKWVVWVNEEGIKIMRSHLKLGSEEQEKAWKRIAHVDTPNQKAWEDLAAVSRARCEWVNETTLESDELGAGEDHTANGVNGNDSVDPLPGSKRGKKRIEKLLVGWAHTAWILHVQEGSPDAQTDVQRNVGKAECIEKVQLGDCIISGLCFYTPSILAILAYRTRDDDDKPIATVRESGATGREKSSSRKGRQHQHTSLAPQLRLMDVKSGEELEVDELSRMSRFETLSSQDYHLGTLYMPPPLPETASEEQIRDKLKGLWDASVAATISGGGYATRIFSSSTSVLSGSSSGKDAGGGTPSSHSRRAGSGKDVTASPEIRRKQVDTHPYAIETGLKLFIHSPYDCVLAVKRELSDHLAWLLEHEQYENAWKLIDSHPEVVDSATMDAQASDSQPTSPSHVSAQQNDTLADFFADGELSDAQHAEACRARNPASQNEKRKIGDLWLQQLVAAGEWTEAGKVAGNVLGTTSRWEYWVRAFAQAGKFDEITPFIPSTSLKPPLPSPVYEVILTHYIGQDRPRLLHLLDEWDPELYDVKSIVRAIEERLERRDVSESSVEGGIRGRDWRILTEALARLYLADGHAREALRCYIRLQDADKAFNLLWEEKLSDVIADDVPSFLTLRLSKDQMRTASLPELEQATTQATQLLVEEAYSGAVPTNTVVRQLEARGDSFRPFLFFYFRSLWNGLSKTSASAPRSKFARQSIAGTAMVEDHADLAVQLFAEYDRELLLIFLQSSEQYSYDKAQEICNRRDYVPELVHILSKTGQTKLALSLIISKLGDVSKAIAFAKNHPDLWDDLLDYSMGSPALIPRLLEEVGAAVAFNPVDVVRRIPENWPIEGLKSGIQHLLREFEIQMSISEGVAKVLRSEVSAGMDTLRAGRRKGMRFEVIHENNRDIEVAVASPVKRAAAKEDSAEPSRSTVSTHAIKHITPGHCVGCGEVFHEDEREVLIGFACGHVYHLSCLLRAEPQSNESPATKRIVAQLTASYATEDEDAGYAGRSVGAKVAHAHMIKDLVEAGCRYCTVSEGP